MSLRLCAPTWAIAGGAAFVALGFCAPAQAQNALEELGSALVADSELPMGALDVALTVVGPQALVPGLTATTAESVRATRPGSSVQQVSSPETRHTSEYQLVMRVTLVGHALEVNLSAFRYVGSHIARVFEPRRTSILSETVRLPLDAQLRALLGPEAPSLPAVTADSVRARSARLRRRDYLAVAVHDFDRDGHSELALVRENSIDIARLHRTERGFRTEHVVTLDLTDLPRSTTRSRRPISTTSPLADGVLIRTSEYATMIRVHFEAEYLHAVAHPMDCAGDGFPSGAECAVRVRGRDYFQAELLARAREPEPTAPTPAPSGFYARATETVRQADGSAVIYEVIVTPRGRLVSRVGFTQGGAQGYGAALGLADLDQDGDSEILASSAAPVGTGDSLRLLRVTREGRLLRVWESTALEGSVTVAGSGDVDNDGAVELLAIEEPIGDRTRAVLWVVE